MVRASMWYRRLLMELRSEASTRSGGLDDMSQLKQLEDESEVPKQACLKLCRCCFVHAFMHGDKLAIRSLSENLGSRVTPAVPRSWNDAHDAGRLSARSRQLLRRQEGLEVYRAGSCDRQFLKATLCVSLPSRHPSRRLCSRRPGSAREGKPRL